MNMKITNICDLYEYENYKYLWSVWIWKLQIFVICMNMKITNICDLYEYENYKVILNFRIVAISVL
jgi:hypothetical protein